MMIRSATPLYFSSTQSFLLIEGSVGEALRKRHKPHVRNFSFSQFRFHRRKEDPKSDSDLQLLWTSRKSCDPKMWQKDGFWSSSAKYPFSNGQITAHYDPSLEKISKHSGNMGHFNINVCGCSHLVHPYVVHPALCPWRRAWLSCAWWGSPSAWTCSDSRGIWRACCLSADACGPSGCASCWTPCRRAEKQQTKGAAMRRGFNFCLCVYLAESRPVACQPTNPPL